MISPHPQHQGEKFVQNLFNRIARRYDLLNRVISFHLDTLWRKRLVNAAVKPGDRLVLDLGTGTGDLALLAASKINRNGKVIGLDLSLEMLRLARAKSREGKWQNRVFFVSGSALAPPLKGEAFDVVISAFVLRNVADLKFFFVNAHRLLGPRGRLVTLDMFPPSGSVFSHLYGLYFYRLVPWIGAVIARERGAYQYLSDSVRHFMSPEAITEVIQQSGFANVISQKFLGGAVCLHMGEKRAPEKPQA